MESEGETDACDGVGYPEEVFLRVLMDHHVTAYLTDVETVVPDLQQAHRLVGHDVEDEDIEGAVADIGERTLQPTIMTVDPLTDVVGHQETDECRYGQ